MGWFNLKFAGADASADPQDYNGETGTFVSTNEKIWINARAIRITDVVLTKTSVGDHQYRIFVNGESRLNDFFSGQINPATEGRIAWKPQNIIIRGQRQIQIKGAQLSGATEETILTIQYDEITGE